MYPTPITKENVDNQDATHRCNEFFSLMKFLSNHYLKNDDGFDVTQLLETNILKLKSHVSNEYGATYQYDDRILFGYCDLLYTLFGIFQESHSYED